MAARHRPRQSRLSAKPSRPSARATSALIREFDPGRLARAAAAGAVLAAVLACALAVPAGASGTPGSTGDPSLSGGPAAPAAASGAAKRPNVVVIQTDDQVRADVDAVMRDANGRVLPVMPTTRRLIGGRGIEFTRYYVSYPLCCPSRVTLLTGQYAHSNGVLGNVAPSGGWTGFRNGHAYHHNLATWLRRAGYRTIHIGKFLNHYGSEERPESTVPPGWAEWQSSATDRSARKFYGYLLNVNGEIQGPYGDPEYGLLSNVDGPGCFYAPISNTDCTHKTDAITRRAVEQIEVSTKIGRPFYMQLDYNAPHGDHQPPIGPEPTPRNYGRADGTPIPRPPSFDERDISDKPSFIRDEAERLSERELRRIRVEYRKTLESLRDVDQGVRRILATLSRTGQLANTYVIFTSDNGFFRGEHRLERAKFLPYEPAVHMPLLIRGPGIRPGTTSAELTANIDIAPTVLRLAGARPTSTIDGRPLNPFWRDPFLRTRRPILLESFARATAVDDAPGEGHASSVGDGGAIWPGRRGVARGSIPAPVQNYAGVRLGPYKYIEYETGDRELYDLARDPHELRNRIRNPNYRPVRNFLARELSRLVDCGGARCRAASAPVPPPRKPTTRRQRRP